MSRTKKQVEKQDDLVGEKAMDDYAEKRSDWEKHQQLNLMRSLIKFQSEVPILVKNSKGYGYNYTDLAEIIKVITPILSKYHLGVIQPLESNGIRTILYHTETGETIESFCEIPQGIELKGMNPYQCYGSAITYFRRYSLSSLLGLVSDKDIDASGETLRKKRSLDTKTFQKALRSIEKGEYSRSELKENYELTTDQLKAL
tara:strand:+ start:857 stop:1459 length:603 start_codon:yes stop_codon:yes gene_type:complete